MWNGDNSQGRGQQIASGAIESCMAVNLPATRQARVYDVNLSDIAYLKAKTQELNSQLEEAREDISRLQGRMAWFMSLPKAAKHLNLPLSWLKKLAANGSVSVLPLKDGHPRVEINTLIRELQKLFNKGFHFDGIVNPKPSKRVIWANVNPLAV